MEIKDMISYLKVIQNPDDTISLLRVINTPARGNWQDNARDLERLRWKRAFRCGAQRREAVRRELLPPRALAALKSFRS